MNSYFWLACALWPGVLGAIMLRVRLREAVRSGAVVAGEADRFSLAFALWLSLPCIALWGIQQTIAGDSTPMVPTWPETQRRAAAFLQVCLIGAFLFWVFVRDGADTMSRFARAAFDVDRLASPVAFKVGALAILGAGLGAWFTII